MPNHITNTISFSGKKAEIDALLKAVKNKDCPFDINSFFPMPKELEGTTSPSKIVSEEERKKWEEKKAKGELTLFESEYAPITLKMQRKFIQKYGADNWYDWRVENWGTKWGAYDVVSNDDGTITFSTAWSTPASAIEELSRLHPTVEITVAYCDEDFGYNVGKYTLFAGVIQNIEQPKGGSIEAIKLAISVTNGNSEDESYYLTDMLCEIDDDELTDFEEKCTEAAHEFGVLCEEYPKPVLEKLLELATRDEQFERAARIKELLENK